MRGGYLVRLRSVLIIFRVGFGGLKLVVGLYTSKNAVLDVCHVFHPYLIEIDLKPYKPHKNPPKFSKTQNFQYPLRVIESKIKEILGTKYVTH